MTKEIVRRLEEALLEAMEIVDNGATPEMTRYFFEEHAQLLDDLASYPIRTISGRAHLLITHRNLRDVEYHFAAILRRLDLRRRRKLRRCDRKEQKRS